MNILVFHLQVLLKLLLAIPFLVIIFLKFLIKAFLGSDMSYIQPVEVSVTIYPGRTLVGSGVNFSAARDCAAAEVGT